MPESPIPAIKAVARLLDQLRGRYAFLGGSVVSLLLDQARLSRLWTKQKWAAFGLVRL